jgi:hypothetical protein
MKDPLVKLITHKMHQVPLTDDGVTWNGKYIMIEDKNLKELLKCPTLEVSDENT